MPNKKLSKADENIETWKEIKKLKKMIEELKDKLHPVELPKQASLATCNKIAAGINKKT